MRSYLTKIFRFWSKNRIRKFIKISELYWFLMHSFLTKMLIFLLKKSHMEIHKDFWIILILYEQFFNKNISIPQNVLKSPKSILPMHSSRKCFNAHTLNKDWIYFFFLIFWHVPILLSIGMPRYRHFLHLTPFFKFFTFFICFSYIFQYTSQKIFSD